MGNPLMGMLGSMQKNRQTPIGNLSQLLSMLKSGNPQDIAMRLAQSNPDFAKFLDANKGKSVDQLMRDYGVDIGSIMNILR